MQTQTPEQIAQLINQYPFIVELIVKRNEMKANRPDLDITVQKADHDFLFKIGVQYDGANETLICSETTEKGTECDFLYFIGDDGRLLCK